jgi:hypothetical protein
MCFIGSIKNRSLVSKQSIWMVVMMKQHNGETAEDLELFANFDPNDPST